MPEPTPDLARQTRRGAAYVTAFWLLLMGALYLVFDQIESRRQAPVEAQVLANGELVIARSRDGHFWIAGEVGGQEVNFLVDTGASQVSVSSELAQAAGLRGSSEVRMQTANGTRIGQVATGVPVRAGPLLRKDSTVVIGLSGGPWRQALLGQDFLRHYDIEMNQSAMRLRPR